MGQILKESDRYCLVLLNESLASTSHVEAIEIGRLLAERLTETGVSDLYVTHYHDLAMNLNRYKGNVGSLVAGKGKDAIIIKSGSPTGISRALAIAEKYGICVGKKDLL